MKLRSISILAAVLTTLVSVAVAAPTNKKSVNLAEPTVVGNVTLPPGPYDVEWNGPGPDVQVSFLKGKNTMATAPATLEAAQNPHDVSVTSRTEESGARLLVEIQTKKATLRFVPRDASNGR